MRVPLRGSCGRVALWRPLGYGPLMALGGAEAVSTPQLDEFVKSYLSAWNACDTEAISHLITDDVVWTDPALPEPARGIAQVQDFMRTSFRTFPDLHFSEPDPPALAVTGDTVLWAWSMRGTHRGPIEPPGFAPTGRTMQIEGVDRWDMRDGRIARYRAFYDLTELARQLGIAPAPGSPAERLAVGLQRLQARFTRR